MRLVFAVCAVILGTNALSGESIWENFKVRHNKSYENLVEESLRYSIFLNNLEKIKIHNARYEAGKETYTLGINLFADMTEREFKEKLRLQRTNKPKLRANVHVLEEGSDVPDSIDWRDKGVVAAVKDQGNCGSCWAFSATGALEGQNAIVNDVTYQLSEQQLLDCSGEYGNGDCEYGGYMQSAFEYVADHGIEPEGDYPYEASQGECRVNRHKIILKIDGYKEVNKTEEDLKNAVGTIGPISVSIYGDPIMFYEAGIFSSDSCYNDEEYLDHGVLAVGYGTEDGTDYWIVKNSWGLDWGENGYIRMERNVNMCGIALDASYPVL